MPVRSLQGCSHLSSKKFTSVNSVWLVHHEPDSDGMMHTLHIRHYNMIMMFFLFCPEQLSAFPMTIVSVAMTVFSILVQLSRADQTLQAAQRGFIHLELTGMPDVCKIFWTEDIDKRKWITMCSPRKSHLLSLSVKLTNI